MASGIKMTVENVSDEAVRLNDLYVTLDAGKSIEFVRSPADLTQMYGLQKLIADEKVTISYEGAPELLDEYGNTWQEGGGGGGGGESSVYVQRLGPFGITAYPDYLELVNPFIVPVSGKKWLLTAVVELEGEADGSGTVVFNLRQFDGNYYLVELFGPAGATLSTTIVRTDTWETEEAGNAIGSMGVAMAAGDSGVCRTTVTATSYLPWPSEP
jgi:hypothetical protein